jgi:hypothetical protein
MLLDLRRLCHQLLNLYPLPLRARNERHNEKRERRNERHSVRNERHNEKRERRNAQKIFVWL